jgi:hypothetical protein
MAINQLDAAAENQKLQDFLASMPDFLEEFVEDAQQEGYTLNYSLASIEDLERYIADNRELLAWKNQSDLSKWQRLYTWCYLGETFRKAFGGEWVVSLDDPDGVNYGQWVIKGFDTVGVEFDPLGILQGYILRGKPGALPRAVEAHVRVTPLDLSDLPAEE